ncbi:MAG: hypothetical protein ACRDZ3_02205 [Acidimicrobiia bacterium]
MGSGGVKRKGRRHLPKVPDGQAGGVPLGQGPSMGPYGAMANVAAAGALARAWKDGSQTQRRLAAAIAAVLGASFVLAIIEVLFG